MSRNGASPTMAPEKEERGMTCEVCITTTDGRGIQQRDCGKLARILVNGFPMCAWCFAGYEEEGLVETVQLRGRP